MGQWGARGLEIEPHHLDAAYVLWATTKLVDVSRLPDRTGRRAVRHARQSGRALLADPAQAASGAVHEGPRPRRGRRGPHRLRLPVDIHLTRTSYAEAIREGRLLLAGSLKLTRTFPTRIRHSPFAGATPGNRRARRREDLGSALTPPTTRLRARDRGRRRPTAAHAATRDGRMTGPAALPANRPTARGTTAVQSTGPATTKTTAEARVAHRAARSSSRSPREPGCRPARGAQPEA